MVKPLLYVAKSVDELGKQLGNKIYRDSRFTPPSLWGFLYAYSVKSRVGFAFKGRMGWLFSQYHTLYSTLIRFQESATGMKTTHIGFSVSAYTPQEYCWPPRREYIEDVRRFVEEEYLNGSLKSIYYASKITPRTPIILSYATDRSGLSWFCVWIMKIEDNMVTGLSRIIAEDYNFTCRLGETLSQILRLTGV